MSSHPAADERERAAEDQRPGSLRSCCREDDGGRAALAQTEDDGLSEADGVHDGLDLGRSIIQRANFRDRVRQPDPGLVEHEDATERGELLEEGLEFGQGPEQLDVADERPDDDELDRPVAEHLIRQAQIAARCVRRFRHRMSVLLSSATTPDFGRSCVPLDRAPDDESGRPRGEQGRPEQLSRRGLWREGDPFEWSSRYASLGLVRSWSTARANSVGVSSPWAEWGLLAL